MKLLKYISVVLIIFLFASCGRLLPEILKIDINETQTQTEADTNTEKLTASTSHERKPKESNSSKDRIRIDKNEVLKAMKTIIGPLDLSPYEYVDSVEFGIPEFHGDMGFGYVDKGQRFTGLQEMWDYIDHAFYFGGISKDGNDYLICLIERFYYNDILERTIVVNNYAVNNKTGEIVMDRLYGEKGKFLGYNEDFPEWISRDEYYLD